VAERRRIVLLGAMAEIPVAGVAWQVLHYMEGFRRLGHDVVYVEDTGTWPYDPEADAFGDDAAPAVLRLQRLMEQAGFGGRWAYVDVARDDEVSGMTRDALDEAIAAADVLVNLSGATVLKEAHLGVPVRIYLETDPVTPQLEIASGKQWTIDFLAEHTHHFSFGERLGLPGCGVPVERFTYVPTRQPVVLDWWPPPAGFPAPPPGPLRFTTVSNWDQPQKDIEFGGETYTWSKSAEFEKLLGVPARVGATLELALALDDAATLARLRAAGFVVGPARALSDDPQAYRAFIRASGAEFTAAKDQNVRLRSGWFSDRTATYLAAGRPAVVQDTGFDAVLPTGEGLLSFRTPDEAVAALQEVASDPARHGAAALAIATEFFDSGAVLKRLLHGVGA
jgi:hypothetical protein